MTKYNIGDRVRVISHEYDDGLGYWLQYGLVGVVTDTRADSTLNYRVEFKAEDNPHNRGRNTSRNHYNHYSGADLEPFGGPW